VASRSLDNRLGSYVALEVARRVAADGGAPGDVAGLAAVQEEVGDFAGSRTAAFELEPAVAIAVDVNHSTDVRGADVEEEGEHKLGSGAAIKAAVGRVGLEGREVEYVMLGQGLQGGAGQAPARQAAVGAGIPIEVPADTINKVCASSIRAVEIADSMIRAGDVEVVVTG